MHPEGGALRLATQEGDSFDLNDWSFGRLCGLSGVTKETVNRLSPETAACVFRGQDRPDSRHWGFGIPVLIP